MVLTETSMSQIDKMKHAFHEAFTIKDLGALSYFLGVKMSRTLDGIFLSQKKYIKDILIDCDMLQCDVSPTPLFTGLKLSIDVGDILHELDLYRRWVGKLLYLGLTRPDLSYYVQHLSQFMHQPRVPHLRAALHIVKYLK